MSWGCDSSLEAYWIPLSNGAETEKSFLGNFKKKSSFMKYPVYIFVFNLQYLRKKYKAKVDAGNGSSYCSKFFYFDVV